MSNQQLFNFVSRHTQRGACTCGRCIDSGPNPKRNQPSGHTVDLTFFKVSVKGSPDVDEFKKLAEPYLPSRETNYLELGGAVGDQGFALVLMGLGHLLGVWQVKSPDTEFPSLDPESKKMMAGVGMVSISPMKEPA